MDALISPRRRRFVTAVGAASLLAACGPSRDGGGAAEFRGPAMGSGYVVKLAGRDASRLVQRAHEAVREALAAVEARMSSWLADSELSRFNRHASTRPFGLSADTFAVVALAQRVAEATGGAFDATIAPAVDAWGFGPGRAHRVVDDAERDAIARRIGHRALALDAATRSARKGHPELALDLAGIAKGYAVDRAAEALDAAGCDRYMVEAGGEVRTRGVNAEGAPWRIGIEQPDAVPQRPHLVVPLSGLALATSGDYRIYFERDGRRYCHEIDPARGAPVEHALASATVAADACAYADAMATALMVMGPERAQQFAAKHGIAAYFIVREQGGLRGFASPAFARLPALPAA
ncbi:MAG: FAD:protein FMN transferase [Betaproteobacteria bacterium]|nr:MAG: FAD:protein FMN transferase [Betaproteobacteria bacterium]